MPFVFCASDGCVKVDENKDGTFTYTSTLGADRGAVTYTAQEVADHIEQVKDGKFDDLYKRASELA
jgi:hypothetical protein